VDFLAIGLRHDAPSEPPESRNRNHLRGAKFVAALAIAALVGVGTYVATYRALVVISTPTALAPTHAPGATVPTAAPPLSRSNV
jgi:hypothetical protein